MSKIDIVRKAMSGLELRAMLIMSPIGRQFASGFNSSAGALLITEHDAWFFTDSRYYEAATSAVKDAHVRLSTRDDPYSAQINTLLGEKNIDAVGFEDGYVTYSAYLDWDEKLTAGLMPAQKLLDNLRIVKSPDDLAGMKKAQRVAEKSFDEILPLISTEITEKQLAAELVCRFLKNGADDKSFDPIVVSGARSSMPHGVPEDINIGQGFLTIDFGVRLDGWCSDTTRTLCVGIPDGEMINVYETVLKAQEAGIAAARAGVQCRDVDAAAREVIDKAGYGENFGHGFGHGLGLEIHEAPTASPSYDDMLPAGAVISAEPGIYLSGRFGVRIEDVIYVTEDGCENITNLTKHLTIL
jgi:Xaa-Pro aminopeptidase